MKFALSKNLFFHISAKQKMLFARNLEMMIRSGMQLLDSLQVLKKQTKSKSLTTVLNTLIAQLKEGRFLSVGLEEYKNQFGEFFINLIRVGEASGTLSENLKYLAEELGKREELKKKIRGAMIYPIVLLVASLGITGMMTFFIFPKILPVLQGLSVDLPFTTRAFMAISGFLFDYGLYLFGFGILAGIGWIFLLRLPKVRFFWHAMILRIPIVNSMSKYINLVMFSRTISLLLRGGVQIVEALNITSKTLPNVLYGRSIRRMAEGVQRGEPISRHLLADPHLFPITFSQMVSVGENTGKLDETVSFLADFYEGELDDATRNMTTVLEPIMLLTMGLVVTFIALAIITPIYKISQSLGR